MKTRILISAFFIASCPSLSLAQTADGQSLADTVRQVSQHIGEMSVSLDAVDVEIEDKLRFEPYQQLEDMFFRDDVVFLMRHGPTDWSKLDQKDVAPGDCDDQRIMSDEGVVKMRDLGTLLASNDVVPSEIVVSEWCRNQQTLTHLFEGYDRVDPEIAANMPVETDPEVNLLLSLQGAKSVARLRDRISSWEGNPTRNGPLLIITHYTNIEELTQFRVFEGEALVLDPKRDNQVLGYVRLESSHPDIGHFKDALDSPLLEDTEALDMVTRYYDAIGAGDRDQLATILSDRWVGHGTSSLDGVQDIDGFLSEVRTITEGLSDSQFDVNDMYVTDDIVTVIGTVAGRHTGDIYGIEATGRDVSFGGIAVHRLTDGKISESWQMADRLSLLQQITD